ncbi:hypothetical protein BLNAU_18935 [Blattamonas nauphoetae]|uniref:Uncharacterized protein n=1 Tax=Blattamonas nauphoetae TaxID=2049346 RepID=A0ABQ9X3G0_9EUKA|nr:hypothetical protein BLNAU_18935 [Blattamonas nauphoetae]
MHEKVTQPRLNVRHTKRTPAYIPNPCPNSLPNSHPTFLSHCRATPTFPLLMFTNEHSSIPVSIHPTKADPKSRFAFEAIPKEKRGPVPIQSPCDLIEIPRPTTESDSNSPMRSLSHSDPEISSSFRECPTSTNGATKCRGESSGSVGESAIHPKSHCSATNTHSMTIQCTVLFLSTYTMLALLKRETNCSKPKT